MILKVLSGTLSNRCPQCTQTYIFDYFVRMRPSCSECGYVYERENGYFMGAVVLGYILGSFSTVPTFIIGIMVMHEELFKVLTLACLQVIVLTPILFRYSRLFWIYLDYRADPLGKK